MPGSPVCDVHNTRGNTHEWPAVEARSVVLVILCSSWPSASVCIRWRLSGIIRCPPSVHVDCGAGRCRHYNLSFRVPQPQMKVPRRFAADSPRLRLRFEIEISARTGMLRGTVAASEGFCCAPPSSSSGSERYFRRFSHFVLQAVTRPIPPPADSIPGFA